MTASFYQLLARILLFWRDWERQIYTVCLSSALNKSRQSLTGRSPIHINTCGKSLWVLQACVGALFKREFKSIYLLFTRLAKIWIQELSRSWAGVWKGHIIRMLKWDLNWSDRKGIYWWNLPTRLMLFGYILKSLEF